MTKDWEPLQEEIRRLYHSEGKPLPEVMRLVQAKHGFIASERAYRTQLRKWDFTKNRTQRRPNPTSRVRRSNRRSTSSNSTRPSGFETQGSLPGDFLGVGGLTDDHDLTVPQLVPEAGISGPQSHVLDQELDLFRFDHNAQDGQGKTQLHRAALNLDIEQVQFLLNAGAALDIQDDMGNTPLHSSVIAQHEAIVDLILRFGTDVDMKNNMGRTPLHLAVSHTRLICALVKHGADPSIRDNNGDTPLHIVLSRSPLRETSVFSAAIDALLKSGADPNRENNAQVTPFLKLLNRPYLEKAVLEAIHSSLQAGGSVHQPLPDGRMPLEIFLSRSASFGFRAWDSKTKLENKIVKYFLAKGASVATLMPSGETFLSAYCNRDDDHSPHEPELGKQLLERITPDQVIGLGNSVLLDLSARNPTRQGRVVEEHIAALLRRGANPNHTNGLGQNALLLVLKRLRDTGAVTERTLALLLRHGANSWQRDHFGNCAVFEAARRFPGETLLQILGEDIRRQQGVYDSETGNSSPTTNEPWAQWQQAVLVTDWRESKQLILGELKSPSNEISNTVRDCAFRVLAEHHIHLAKDKFQGETELWRKYVAGIFLDCAAREINLDASCVRCLAELSLC